MDPLTRLFTVVALVAAISNADPICAQFTYQAEVFSFDPMRSPKPMMAELVGTLGVTYISHDRETRSLLFNSPTTVTFLQLGTLIEPHGFVLIGFNPTGAAGDEQWNNETSDILFPTMIDTGNEIEDNSRYETAKSQWIQTHQLEYNALISGEQPGSKDNDK